MAKVSIVGSLTCLDGKNDEMEEVLAAMVAAAGEEPGTEVYSYHRGEGNTYWFFALMSSREAMETHGRTPAMQTAMEAFGPVAAGPPQMWVTTPVAALGIDLD